MVFNLNSGYVLVAWYLVKHRDNFTLYLNEELPPLLSLRHGNHSPVT